MTCLFGLKTDGIPWLVFCWSKRCFEERCPNVLTCDTDAHVLWWELTRCLRPVSSVHTAAQISQPAKKRARQWEECIRKEICHYIRATVNGTQTATNSSGCTVCNLDSAIFSSYFLHEHFTSLYHKCVRVLPWQSVLCFFVCLVPEHLALSLFMLALCSSCPAPLF